MDETWNSETRPDAESKSWMLIPIGISVAMLALIASFLLSASDSFSGSLRASGELSGPLEWQRILEAEFPGYAFDVDIPTGGRLEIEAAHGDFGSMDDEQAAEIADSIANFVYKQAEHLEQPESARIELVTWIRLGPFAVTRGKCRFLETSRKRSKAAIAGQHAAEGVCTCDYDHCD